MGFTGAAAANDLLDELARRRGRVREIFTRYFNAEQAPDSSAARLHRSDRSPAMNDSQLVLITGGSRSGKSSYAMGLAAQRAGARGRAILPGHRAAD